MIHQKIDAVFLGSDGVGFGLRNTLHDLRVFHVQLVTAGRARFRPQLASNDQRRFLRQVLERLERLLRQRALHGHALQDARAVAHLRETNFPAAAQIIEPARDFDRLARVLSCFGDRHPPHRCFRIHRPISTLPNARTPAEQGRSGAPCPRLPEAPEVAGTDPVANAKHPSLLASRWCLPWKRTETGVSPLSHYCHASASSECDSSEGSTQFPHPHSCSRGRNRSICSDSDGSVRETSAGAPRSRASSECSPAALPRRAAEQKR